MFAAGVENVFNPQRDDSSRLLASFFAFSRATLSFTEGFNANIVSKAGGFHSFFRDYRYTIQGVGKLWLEIDSVTRPNSGSSKGSSLVYPRQSQLENSNYTAKVHGFLCFESLPLGGNPNYIVRCKSSQAHELFPLPAMIGSELDNLSDYLRNPTPENQRTLLELGHDPNFPSGYFIVHGTRMISICCDKVSFGIPVISFSKKENMECRLTTVSSLGTTLIRIQAHVNTKYQATYPGLLLVEISEVAPRSKTIVEKNGKKKTRKIGMPVLSVLRLLYEALIRARTATGFAGPRVLTVLALTEHLLRFTKVEFRQRVSHFLALDLQFQNTVVEEDLGRRFFWDGKKDITDVAPVDQDRIFTDVVTKIFPNVNPKDGSLFVNIDALQAKIDNLCGMVILCLEQRAGVREFHNRNGWDVKRIVTPDMEILRTSRDMTKKAFNITFSVAQPQDPTERKKRRPVRKADEGLVQEMEALRNMIANANGGNHAEMVSIETAIKSKFFISLERIFKDPCTKIGKDIASAIHSKDLGDSGGSRKENSTDILEMDSPSASYSQITRIKSAASSKDTSVAPRALDHTAVGVVCPGQTQERRGAGLTKYLSAGCIVCWEVPSWLAGIENLYKRSANFRDRTYPYSPDFPNQVWVNGGIVGWSRGTLLREEIVNYRITTGALFVSAYMELNALIIQTDAGRPCRPLLRIKPRVPNQSGKLDLYLPRQYWNRSPGEEAPSEVPQFWDLLQLGAVEFLSVGEAVNTSSVYICQNLQDILDNNALIEETEARYARGELPDAEYLTNLYANTSWTHCELDPSIILGLSAGLIPYSDRNMTPRNVFQSNMNRQILGNYSQRMDLEMGTTMKTMPNSQRPMLETEMHRVMGLDNNASGSNVNVVMMPYQGFNREDGIPINKGSVQRGLFNTLIYFTEYHILKNVGSWKYELGRPSPKPEDDPDVFASVYRHIGDDGLPKMFSATAQGDCYLGLLKRNNSTGEVLNASRFTRRDNHGTIDLVHVSTNLNGEIVVAVRIRQFRYPQPGDKAHQRASQKGVYTVMVNEEDMPFIVTVQYNPLTKEYKQVRLPVDIMFSPFGIVSRMTMNFLMEMLLGLYGMVIGRMVLAMSHRKPDLAAVQRLLLLCGFNASGMYEAFSGETGKPIGSVYYGPVSYGALRHMIKDKGQARDTGPVKPIFGQPVRGNGDTGFKIGEQEGDSIKGWGAAAITKERLSTTSDAYPKVGCVTCGTCAIVDKQSAVCLNCEAKGVPRAQQDLVVFDMPRSTEAFKQYAAGGRIEFLFGLRKVKEIY